MSHEQPSRNGRSRAGAASAGRGGFRKVDKGSNLLKSHAVTLRNCSKGFSLTRNLANFASTRLDDFNVCVPMEGSGGCRAASAL